MIVEQLKDIVGERGWMDSPSDLQPYLNEWRDQFQGKARILVAPQSTAEVSAVVKACAEQSVGIVPQGGNTGLCGGAIPDASGRQVILSLRRINRIREISVENYSAVVDAGCTLKQVQDAAKSAGRFFPLSLAAEGSCQIGGNLATNAGGINVLRYGTARNQVMGLEVVLPDGSIIEGLRALRKDTAGYDLKQLFIGSEGTLGIITAASLQLQAIPREVNTAMLAVATPADAVCLLAKLRDELGEPPQAFELISARALRFVLRHIPATRNPFADTHRWMILMSSTAPSVALERVLARVLEEGLLLDAVLPKSESEADALWKIRHTISEAQKPEGASLKHDISVPVVSVGSFIEAADSAVLKQFPEARIVAFGHVGDGNIHYNVSQPGNVSAATFLAARDAVADSVYQIVASLGGSFSAEHGIGQARRDCLKSYRSPVELATMRAIKRALDPQGIMNPGKVL